MNENLTKAKINLNEGTIELEGSEEFVQKNLDGFKDFISKPLNAPAKGVKSITDVTIQSKNNVTKQSKSSSVVNVTPEEFDIRGNDTIPSFKKFLEEKKPSDSAPEMIAVTGFYLKHYLKKEEFSEGNIMYAYVAAGVKRPMKVHQAFIDTKNNKHWILQGSDKDKWILNQLGEDYVLHELPKTTG